MFATAFNDRFFTYTFPQRLGGAIDWYGILGAEHGSGVTDSASFPLAGREARNL